MDLDGVQADATRGRSRTISSEVSRVLRSPRFFSIPPSSKANARLVALRHLREHLLHELVLTYLLPNALRSFAYFTARVEARPRQPDGARPRR